MKNKLKRFLKSVLIIILIFSFLPLNILYANLQNPITNLTIENYTFNANQNYQYKLKWDEPTVSNEVDNTPNSVDQDASGKSRTEGYEVFMRSATAGQRYPNAGFTNVDAPALYIDLLNNQNGFSVIDGSVYALKVIPYHFHRINLAMGGVKLEKAKMASQNEKEVLLMTDLMVDAEASGNEMTVIWDNPTMDRGDIFFGYRIYYALHSTGPVSTQMYHDVFVDNEKLERTPEGKLKYKFTSTNFMLGQVYDVKIEPLTGKNEIARERKKINIKGEIYDIAYSSMSREFRTDSIIIKPVLTIKDVDADTIKVFWDKPFVGLDVVEKVELYESDTEDFNGLSPIETLVGDNAIAINEVILRRPNKVKYYILKIYYRNQSKDLFSEIAIYTPGAIEFAPYSPNIVSVTDNREKPLIMEVTWDSFMRRAYGDEVVDPRYDLYVDKEVQYDVYITDDVNNFEDPSFNAYPLFSDIGTMLKTDEVKTEDGKLKVVFKKDFEEYMKRNSLGGYDNLPFEENKNYYIKIVAKRIETGEISTPAYWTHYIFPIGSINNQPVMISKPPLRIKKDEKGIDEITMNSITIEWDKTWNEAFDYDSQKWYPKIGVDNSGKIIFDREADKLEQDYPDRILYLNKKIYLDQIEIVKKLKELNANINQINSLPIRKQNLKDDVNYEIIVMPYKDLDEKGGYDTFVEEISKEANDGLWQQIEPDGGDESPYYKVDGLDKNTTYIIFFRPYYEDANGKKAAYLPNFVIGTTLKESEELDITPTVPTLTLVDVTDTTATVKWPATENFKYELYISENEKDYPNGGMVYLWEQIDEKKVVKKENDKEFYQFTFENLFPDTDHLAWIRAYVQKAEEKNFSAYSNPVYFKTLDIIKPEPPGGLSFASEETIFNYNNEKGTELKQYDKDYIIVEWLKDLKDTGLIDTDDKNSQKDDNNKKAEWLKSDDLTHIYIAKFNELIANKPYYVRAKTRLAISRDEDGKIYRTYNYTVQLSPDEDFLDFIEIVIPPISEKLSKPSKDVKIKESDWSKSVKVFSGKTDSEYDGDKDPNNYPLPIKDFEYIYDSKTQTLTQRLRSDKIDSDGNKDNSVDQRFISEVLNSNVYNLTFDLSYFEGKTIVNRKLELPLSIFNAINERKISTTIAINGSQFKFPFESLVNDEYKKVTNKGKDTSIIITFSENTEKVPSLGQSIGNNYEEYATMPQTLKVEVKTTSKTTKLSKLAKELEMSLKLDHRYGTVDGNINAYFSDGNTGKWKMLDGKYQAQSGTIEAKTKNIGAYSSIKTSIPEIINFDPYLEATYSLFSKLNIKDVIYYDPMLKLNNVQFNNLILGIAKNEKSFTINKKISKSDIEILNQANLYMVGEVTKEKAIASLVKLYELKTKQPIKDYVGSAGNMIDEIEQVYQESFDKAYKIELLDDIIKLPKDVITFGEVLYYLDFIINS